LYVDSDAHCSGDDLEVSREHVLLRRTGCAGESARRVEALWGDRVADGRLTLDKIVIKAVR
jgi:hypothetical protein